MMIGEIIDSIVNAFYVHRYRQTTPSNSAKIWTKMAIEVKSTFLKYLLLAKEMAV
jgi:hypothetical protein